MDNKIIKEIYVCESIIFKDITNILLQHIFKF